MKLGETLKNVKFEETINESEYGHSGSQDILPGWENMERYYENYA